MKITPSRLKTIVKPTTEELNIDEYVDYLDHRLERGYLISDLEFPTKHYQELSHKVKSYCIIEGFKCNWIPISRNNRYLGSEQVVEFLGEDKVRMRLEFYVD